MARPKVFRAQLSTITHAGQSEMRERANLDFASTRGLIEALVKRGYRTFLASRVIECKEGWIILATEWELKRRMMPADD